MASEPVTPTTPKGGRRWLPILGIILGGVLALLLAAYFVATSGAFLKSVVLPRIGKAVNAEITVSDASISPFHEVVLKDLKVKTTGSDPLVSIPEVRLRYKLMEIISGNINVDEVLLGSPTIILTINPDGASNLDPLTKSAPKGEAQPAKPTAPAKLSKPLRIDLKKFSLTAATVRAITLHTNGNRDVYEATNINLTLNGLQNGQTAKLALAATLRARKNPPAPAPAALVQASLSVNLDVGLTADAKFAAAKGNIHFVADQAEGALAQLASFSIDLDCDLTPTDLKGLALRFQKGAASLGQVRASGPFDMAKMEGRIVLEIPAIDKQLLNLATTGSGMDFGGSVIRSTNTIVLAQSGSLITAAGQLNVRNLQVTRTNQTTPTLDVQANYDVSVDRAQNNAVLRAVNLAGTQQGSPFLHAELTSPMTIAWGKSASAVGDSTFNLGISGLNLANWKPFLGTIAPAGMVNAQVKVLSQQAGKHLALDLDSTVENLTVMVGTNALAQIGVALQMKAQARDFKRFSLDPYKFQVSQRNQPLLNAAGSASFDNEAQDTSLKLDAQVMVARLFQALSLPALPSGSNAPSELDLAADIAVHKKVTDIRQFNISLGATARATNQFALTGHLDLTQANALQGSLKLAAGALDFAPYYDLFMGGSKPPVGKPAPAAANVKASATTANSDTTPAQEPAPLQLPIGAFTIDTTIHHLYLHEVEIADFQTSTKLESGRVTVTPFKLSLNGAPVTSSAVVDLSVPGYKYDLTFDSTEIPLAPLVNTFQPDRKGQISGTLTAAVKIAGSGVTGASIKTNLTGQFYIGTTNLNLAVQNVQNKVLKSLLMVITEIPDLAKDPASAAMGLVSKFTGSSQTSSPGELQKSVVDAIVLRGTAGSGQVAVQQATIRGNTFLAESTGAIALDAALPNSTLNFPVSVSLVLPVAQRIHLVPANTATNAAYAKLPDFLTMKGTLGAPKADVNKLALLRLAAQGVGGKAGGIAQGLTGLLGSGNSASGTNTGKGNGLLQGLGGLLNKPTATTNTSPSPTNASPVGNLLDGIFGPKSK